MSNVEPSTWAEIAALPLWLRAMVAPFLLGFVASLVFFLRASLRHVLGVEPYPWGNDADDPPESQLQTNPSQPSGHQQPCLSALGSK